MDNKLLGRFCVISSVNDLTARNANWSSKTRQWEVLSGSVMDFRSSWLCIFMRKVIEPDMRENATARARGEGGAKSADCTPLRARFATHPQIPHIFREPSVAQTKKSCPRINTNSKNSSETHEINP